MDKTVHIKLDGRIDSGNAEDVKESLMEQLADENGSSVVIDAENLEYISSAGLRVILQIRKNHEDFHIINVNPEVYEIFDMTGFTEMMEITRAYRTVTTDGCEVIGKGANGTIFRIDDDNVVKVYNNADALEDIQHEREVAKLALVLGIPTAISYDVVKVGESYGSVFELLNARSFSMILAEEPEKIDWCVSEYVELLKKIHSTEVPEGKLPDMKETAVGWAEFTAEYLPEELGRKLIDLVRAVPQNNHMIHGDYHTKNVQLAGDEVLLIDMDTLAVGDPVFEFGSMFNAYIGFSESDPEIIVEFQGFDHTIAEEFWRKTLREYFGTEDETVLQTVEDKSRIVGYTRLIRRSIRRKGLETEKGRAEIDNWKAELCELLQKVDKLTF